MKLTEQYSLVDAVLNPTAAMEIHKKLCLYESTELEPDEIKRLKKRVDILRKLLNSLRKEIEKNGINRGSFKSP